MVRCFILRGFWTWWSHDQSFPNLAEKCEILTKPQQFEKWHFPIWMVQLVPRPIFNRNNESGHKIALFNLEHLSHPNQWWEHQERLGNILQMGWFDLYMDLFFKENPDLKREIWNSHQITLYSCFKGNGWNWEQVICSKWDGSTCMLLEEANGHEHLRHFQETVLYVH